MITCSRSVNAVVVEQLVICTDFSIYLVHVLLYDSVV